MDNQDETRMRPSLAIAASAIALITLVAVAVSCATEEPPQQPVQQQTPPPGPSEEERTSAVSKAAEDLEAIRAELDELRARARAEGLESDAELKDRLDRLSDAISEGAPAVDALERASASRWDEAQMQVEKHQEALQLQFAETRKALATRAEEAREERIAAIEPTLERGIVKGLGGEPYSAYKRSVIRSVQERLKEIELYYGPADGYLEETTKQALAQFQEQNGLQPTGVPTPRTRSALLGS
jgi:hypothetical protein